MAHGVHRTVMAALLLLLGVAPSGQAGAELDPALKDMGWDEIVFDKKAPNSYRAPAGALPPGEAIEVVSESTVSVAYLDVDIDIEATPILEWEWLSRDPDPDTDTTRKGGDDRTLTIYIAFPWQSEHASFGEQLQRPLVEVFRGKDTPGRVLSYIWGGGAPVGADFENPYAGKYGRMIILKGPGTGLDAWHPERVDVRGDFTRVFGFEPADPSYIGVGTDTDDTAGVVRAGVRGLRFAAP